MPPTYNSFQFNNRVQIPKEILPYLSRRFYSVDKKVYQTALSYVMSVNASKLHQIKARARATVGSIDHVVPLSDELTTTCLAAAIANAGLMYIPGAFSVYLPHHIVTRLGPIRWLRLLWSLPHRAAWENLLHELDPKIYSATQTLDDAYVGDNAPRSAGTTFEYSPMTLRHLFTLVKHIASGSSGTTYGRMLGAGTAPPVGPPMFSVYAARHFMYGAYLTVLPTLVKAVCKINPVAPLMFALNHPVLAAASVLPLAIAGVAACPLAARAHNASVSHVSRFFRAAFPTGLLSDSIRATYFKLKLAQAPKSVAGPGPRTIVIDPTVQRSSLLPADPNDLGDDDSDDSGSGSDFGPPPEKAKGHGYCTSDTCPEHSGEESAMSDCLSGVEFNGLPGGRCHLCPIARYGRPPRTPESDNQVPACDTKLTHETCPECPHDGCALNSASSCLAVEGAQAAAPCPHCLEMPPAGCGFPPYPASMTCLFDAVSTASGVSTEAIWSMYSYKNERATAVSLSPAGMDEYDVNFLAIRMGLKIIVKRIYPKMTLDVAYGLPGGNEVLINYRPGHYFADSLHGGYSLPQKPAANNKFVSTWHNFVPDYRAADGLIKNIESGHFGVLLPRDKALLRKLRSLVTSPGDYPTKVQIGCVFGMFGSGKSYPWIQKLKRIANGDADHFRWVTSELELRTDAASKFNLKSGLGYRVSTLEVPFTGSYAPLMILDDVGKFPPGYTTLLALACPGITHILVNGDPSQCVYHCPKPGNTLNSMRAEIDALARYCSEYKMTSTRPSCGVAHELGVPHACNSRPGTIIRNAQPNANLPVLTSSDAAATTLTNLGRDARTASSSQGLTLANHYEIIVDKHLLMADDRLWYTALTRGKRGIALVYSVGNMNKSHIASRIAQALLTGTQDQLQQAIANHIAKYTPARLLDPNKLGASTATKLLGGFEDADRLESFVDALPHLSGIIDTTPEPCFPADGSPEPTAPVPTLAAATFSSLYDIASHGIDQLLSLVGINIDEVRPSDEREVLIDDLLTTQVVPDSDLDGLFIRHRRGDLATEQWTLKGRYVYPDGRTQKSESVQAYALYAAWLNTYRPTPQPFDQTLWELCAKEDQETFLSKGVKRLIQIADRADPDWHITYAELFMKGQAVTKPGTIGRDAKKGQLIVSFSTELNYRFGTLAKYMSKMLKRSLPAWLFLLDGKTDSDMNEFVQGLWDFNVESSEDDYEGFDSTQGPEFQVFDAMVMRFFGVPEAEIEFYLWFVTVIHTFLGLMGPMMASGFKFTLIFNTLRSLAYQALKYTIPYGTPMAATGDDVALNAVVPYSSQWTVLERMFRLISKRQVSMNPTFCGWKFCAVSIYKLPSLIWHRTVYQMNRGNLPKCLLNYMADVTPLNANLELVSEHLTEKELEDHFATMDLLRAEAKATGMKVFGNFTTTYGSKKTYDIREMVGGFNKSQPPQDSDSSRFTHPHTPPRPLCLTLGRTAMLLQRHSTLSGPRSRACASLLAALSKLTTVLWKAADPPTAFSMISSPTWNRPLTFSMMNSVSRPASCAPTSPTTTPTLKRSSSLLGLFSATGLPIRLRIPTPAPATIGSLTPSQHRLIRGCRTTPNASRNFSVNSPCYPTRTNVSGAAQSLSTASTPLGPPMMMMTPMTILGLLALRKEKGKPERKVTLPRD